MSKETILTGIRSNGELTLGNYLGAITPMVRLQQQRSAEYNVNFFVPDLHSFTTEVDHKTLYNQTLENLRTFAAAGFDFTNESTFVYRQSFIPAHSELFTILNNFAYFGELSRMTQFKEKAGTRDILQREKILYGDIFTQISEFENKHGHPKQVLDKAEKLDQETVTELAHFYRDMTISLHGLGKLKLEEEELTSSVTSGVFTYPVLMAADILLYGAKYVPVGDDQRQHLELTRDLAIRFNNKFGDIFTIPVEWKEQLAFYQRDNGLRIRSLRNPEKKMSKSVSDPAGTILLTDNPAEAAKKIMSATTDSFGEIKFDLAERPGISNLLQILAVVSNRTQAEVNAEWEGKTAYGDLKKATAEAVEQLLTTFQANLAAVDNAQIMAKLEQSEALMRETTAPLLLEVQKAVGLRSSQ